MSIKDNLRVWIHKVFHEVKYDEPLFKYTDREYYDQEWDTQTFCVCSKCGVYTEDFGYRYEQRVGDCVSGEIVHYVNYYPTDKEYKELRNKQLVKKLIK